MASGSIVNKWMLEFAICDLKNDKLVEKMLSVMPVLENDVGLKKTILLRAMESEVAEYSVSEKILDALEITFMLDQQAGCDVLESMKTAYFSVAIDCVARFAKSASEEDEYFDAVERIWRKRIGRLRSQNVELISEHLEIWMDNIESAVWDVDLRGKFFDRNTRYEALVAVKKYLVEAWETVGPKFTSRTLGKSLAEAQLLCLQKISETNKDRAVKLVNNSQGVGASSNPTAHNGGEVLKGPHDPSSLVSSSLLKINDQEPLKNIQSQNSNGKIHEGGSNGTQNLNCGENVRPQVIGVSKEQNLLDTSCGLTEERVENIETVQDKGNAIEKTELPLPGTCDDNIFNIDGLVEGGGMDVVKEKKDDWPSSSHHAISKVRVRRKHVGGRIKLSKRVRINDSEDMDQEGSNRQHNPLSEDEVIKIHEKFISNSRELQDVVTDPLPDALHLAEAVMCNLSKNSVPQGAHATSLSDIDTLKSHVSGEEKGNYEASTSYKNNATAISMEGNSINQAYETDPIVVPNNESSLISEGNGNHITQLEVSGHENRQGRVNLWERNAGTRVYEWEDSADGSSEGNLRLPTPKNCVNSPLKRYECQKFGRRRQIKRWSVLEEDTLKEGVQRYGRGNWKMILNAYRDIFEERTEVDLKDKWRRMIS